MSFRAATAHRPMAALLLVTSLVCASITGASAQAASEAPYDSRLNRLSERLGAIHYLDNLCREANTTWRDQMQTMLSLESPDPVRRARLVASFNRGYRSFASVYTTCTDQARSAASDYVREGAEIAGEISTLFSD